MIPVAMARFRLSARPRIGILTLTSQAAASWSVNPACSLPIRISDGFCITAERWLTLASSRVPTTLPGQVWRQARKASGSVRVMETAKTEPMVARTASTE